MKYKTYNTFILISLLMTQGVSCCNINEPRSTTPRLPTHVKVQQGWLAGEILSTTTGDGSYFSFKGIPYARPPVDNLRFKAPQAPLPWTGIRNATEHGSVCPQRNLFPPQEFIPGNEDCLFLNIYTKNLTPPKPQAVMFFIHGGGFQCGSGNVNEYGPDFLVNYDVVLVTINYRVGALGFLSMETEEVPGNAGLKDQVMALKWVKENIAQFGGDPNNVTIFGQSAGGASTTLHVLSPMSKGLFQRAIAMSGVPICDWTNSFEPRRRAFALGKELGYETKNPAELLTFLQSLPSDKLIDSNYSMLSLEQVNMNIFKRYYYAPVVEKQLSQNNFLSENVFDILKNGNVNDVDFVIGHTSLETLFDVPNIKSSLIPQYNRYNEIFVPDKILYNIAPIRIFGFSDKIRQYYFGDDIINLRDFITYSSDSAMSYCISRFINLFPKHNSKLYQYKFSCISDRNIYGSHGFKYGIYGASHLDDLMYLFDKKNTSLTIDKNSSSYKMIHQTCKLFTNFAKFGNPTPDLSMGVIWKEYDKESQYYLDINETLALGQHLDEDTVAFWNGIHELADVEY